MDYFRTEASMVTKINMTLLVIGFLLTVLGFALWYWRVQHPTDIELRERARSAVSDD